MPFRFNLVTVEGEDLGIVAVAVPNWPEGAILQRGAPGTALRIVRVVDPPDDEQPVLVVEEV